MSVPMKQVNGDAGNVMESVIAKGDLGKLTPDERVRYYNAVCNSMGLNPLTQPFAFITLNNKLTLYALRTCADQLRKINGVSLEIVSREVAHDILTIHVRAKLPDGRSDEDLGAVSFPDTLRGEARANAELKAVTKAKRRATLSICGLGWLDETEVEDIPGAKRPAQPAPLKLNAPAAAETGEIVEPKLIEVPHGADETANWIAFGQSLIAAIKIDPASSVDWLEKNRTNVGALKEQAPKVYERMMAAIDTATDQRDAG